MAESMVGLKRSHRCTELTSAQIGEKVTVMGWVQKSRNKGGIIFVDLKKRNGRFGGFWGCTGFPDCRYTENI